MHSLSSRQVRKNQILGDWIERFHRNLRLGSKTLPQIHGFQILLRAATQGLGEISVCAIGLVLAILKSKESNRSFTTWKRFVSFSSSLRYFILAFVGGSYDRRRVSPQSVVRIHGRIPRNRRRHRQSLRYLPSTSYSR